MCFKIVFGLKLSALLDLKNRYAMVAVGGVKGIRDADQVWPGTSNAYPDRFAGGRSCLEGRQGRRPSLAGYQENFAGGRSRPEGRQGRQPSLAGYQENFAGGRSRPEASESIKTRR